MGNCCGSESPSRITEVVVFDPETRQAARVRISPSDDRLTGHQRKTVPAHWNAYEIFCENPQAEAPNRRYDIKPDKTPRHPQVWIGTVRLRDYWRSETDRALYFGQIPN